MTGALTFLLYLFIVLVVVSGAWVLYRYLSFKKSRPAGLTGYQQNTFSADNELNSLGILDIREKDAEKTSVITSDAERPNYDPGEKTMVDTDYDEVAGDEAASAQTVFVDHNQTRLMESPEEEDVSGDVFEASHKIPLIQLLQAVKSTIGAHTTGLFRVAEPHRYHVEAMVSDSAAAWSEPVFTTSEPLYDGGAADKAVDVRVLDENVPTNDVLGYYHVNNAVKQVAVAPVKIPDMEQDYILVVDVIEDQKLDDPWQRLLLGQYATLFGTYLGAPSREKKKLNAHKIRPRRDIILEEMSRSRELNTPLALALVYLNDAEQIASRGEDAVSEAESVLSEYVEAVSAGSRFERFGELTFGVFLEDTVNTVESWAVHLQETIEQSGNFAASVSIGIAFLKNRHEHPEDFRADATAALHEAYETGACTIIE